VEVERVAVAVAAGKHAVLADVEPLPVIAANRGHPVPVAVHRTGDWCSVFFVTNVSDDQWRADIVPVRDGEVTGYGGGTGGILQRRDVERGKPYVEGLAQHFLDEERALVQADGVSADDRVRMLWRGEVVAEAQVAPHGYFLLTAILPAEVESETTVEAA
jgi:hypothetical protein